VIGKGRQIDMHPSALGQALQGLLGAQASGLAREHQMRLAAGTCASLQIAQRVADGRHALERDATARVLVCAPVRLEEGGELLVLDDARGRGAATERAKK
jgi:hypothetical protein